jgi:hypothetical protein
MCLCIGRLFRDNNIAADKCDDFSNLIRPVVPPPQNKLFVAAPLIFRNNNIKIGSTDSASRLRIQVTPEGTIFAVPEGRVADQGSLPSADLEETQKMNFFEKEKLQQLQFVPGIGSGELGEKEQMKLFGEAGGK